MRHCDIDVTNILAIRAPQAIATRVGHAANANTEVERLSAGGYRVLAVAGGPEGEVRLVGLLALQDPPREDSKSLVASLNKLGVRVAMVTGDGIATAQAVAAQVGIAGRACSAQDLRESIDQTLDCAIFAGVFPEDKFRLVRALQQAGHIVGMTGDGVNDAPALKQAEVGIAVASATDVAKASASLVLTNPGLTDTLAAVETSRRIYQRMLTYTLNKIIKTVEVGLFLSIGVILTRTFIITPLLIVMLLFTNDFVTMSIATDRVSASPTPDRWHIRTLMLAGMSLGSLILLLSFGLFFYGRDFLGLPLPQLQTLVFVTLVFTGQGMVYLVRERRHFWNSAPSRWMILSSILDVIVVCLLSTRGILMAPLPDSVVGLVILASVLYLIALDFLKVPILRRRNVYVVRRISSASAWAFTRSRLVALVKKDQMPQFKKILCPVDFDPNSLLALRLASELAQEGKATLHLLHVVAMPPGPEVALPFGKMETAARTRLERLARQKVNGKARYQIEVMMGDPAVEVLQAAKRLRANLIVMATHGRKGLRRSFSEA